jgi:N-acetylglucosamine kinase-like BadF-type ATPase
MTKPVVLAVDGGNSKVDVALLAADGRVLAAVRGPTVSHQAIRLADSERRFRHLVEIVRAAAGVAPGRRVPLGVACLAGADYPADIRHLRTALADASGSEELVVLNDTYAALRAGATRPWGIALICGQGINGAAVSVDGRRTRFAGVGDIAGDWGGGGSVGQAGLAAAVRGQDGRGPRTTLERSLPSFLGLRRPDQVTYAYYAGRLDEHRIGDLAPTVFATALDGDPVARSIIDRLADELVVMAAALARRANLVRRDPDVVLGGSVFRTDDAAFHERVRSGVLAAVPAARIVRLASPPVLGAALLGLDRLAPSGVTEATVTARARAGLDAWNATAEVVTTS